MSRTDEETNELIRKYQRKMRIVLEYCCQVNTPHDNARYLKEAALYAVVISELRKQLSWWARLCTMFS